MIRPRYCTSIIIISIQRVPFLLIIMYSLTKRKDSRGTHASETESGSDSAVVTKERRKSPRHWKLQRRETGKEERAHLRPGEGLRSPTPPTSSGTTTTTSSFGNGGFNNRDTGTVTAALPPPQRLRGHHSPPLPCHHHNHLLLLGGRVQGLNPTIIIM